MVIDLDDQDDAQLIFETLNFLGQPLLPADLVKNYLFHHASRSGADIEPLYHKHWAAFDKDGEFWRQKVTQGRLTRPRLDLYLQHYLTRRRQKVIGPHTFSQSSRTTSARATKTRCRISPRCESTQTCSAR